MTHSLSAADFAAADGHGALGAASKSGARGNKSAPATSDLPRPVRNRLLAALPVEELARIESHLEPVSLEQRDTLFEPEQPIRHVYFPETCVVSLVNTLQEGGSVEVGTVGCEGIAGLAVFLGDVACSVRAIVQIPGTASRIAAETFEQLAASPSCFHRLLLRYTQAFLTQVAQTAACNAAHLVDERCARWLLMTRDRVDGDEFPLTHEFLAFMLGVRRAGVTVAMSRLQEAGLIRYSRGSVAVVDREGLERASCECYHVVRAHFDRLLPAGVSVSVCRTDEMAANPSPGDADDAAVVRELVRRALRCAIDAELDGRAGAGVGPALREACDVARQGRLRAEELLIVLKQTWRQLPETRQLRSGGDEALARVVTACIGEYYRVEARADPQRGSR